MSSFNQAVPGVPTLINSSSVLVTGNAASANALTVRQYGGGNVFSAQTTTGSTALFVSGSGNVGVGTTNPRSKFTVENGNIYMNYDTYSNCFIGGGPSGAQGQSYVGFTFPGEYDTHQLEFGCHGTLSAFFKRNYNDGINQFNILSNVFVNPQYFNGPALAVRPQTGGTTGPIVQFSNIAGGANTFIMTDTGRIGIGTNNATKVLTIVGQAGSSPVVLIRPDNTVNFAGASLQIMNSGTGDGSPSTLEIGCDGAFMAGTAYISAATASTPLQFRTAGTTRMTVASGGSVGIGTTNPSSYTLQVSGTIGATGDITAYFSDERLKTKTGRIESALEKVLSLEAFTYVPNDLAKSFGFEVSKQRVGLSAQSVQRVLPEAVCPAPFDADNASGQGYLTVQYDKLVPLLVEAIKELAGRG